MSFLTYSRRLFLGLAATIALAGTLTIAATIPADANHNNYRYDRWSSYDDCSESYCGRSYSDYGRRHYRRGCYDSCYCDRGYRGQRTHYRDSYRDHYYDDRYRYRRSYYDDRYDGGYYRY
jgi:hypothetical protein